MKKLKPNTWYWMSYYQEGDVYYPVYAISEDEYKLDEKVYPLEGAVGLDFTEAVMPKYQEGE